MGCVCAFISVLIDGMNSGSGKLILAEADPPSLSGLLSLAGYLSTASSHPIDRAPPTCFHSLMCMTALKNSGKKTLEMILSSLTRCLLAQVKLLHHLYIFSPFFFDSL